MSIPDILTRLSGAPVMAAATMPAAGGLKKNSLTDSTRLPGVPAAPKPIPTDVPITLEHINASWAAIIEHMEARGGGMAAKVGPAKPIAYQNGLLTLAFNINDPSSKMYVTVCEQPGTKDRLQTAFSEVLGTPIVIKTVVQQIETQAAASAFKPKGARTSQKELDEILSDPAIKMLQLGLNARVTGVEEDAPEASSDEIAEG
jgi:hypothetical protein